MSRQCKQCGKPLQAEDCFCGECGATIVPESTGLACPSCGAEVAKADRFCPGCGEALQPVAVAPEFLQVSPEKYCIGCEHFRPAQPVSRQLPKFGPATAIAQAFLKVEEEEQKLRASEVKHKANQINTSNCEWGFEPQISDFCAAKAADGRYEICELKNRAHDCPDYQSRTSAPVQCDLCKFYVRGSDNPFPAPYGDPQLNAKRREAVDAELALEIQSLFWNKGEFSHKPIIHDVCTHFCRALPYVNMHHNCQSWKRRGVVASKLFDSVRKKKEKKND